VRRRGGKEIGRKDALEEDRWNEPGWEWLGIGPQRWP